MNRNFSAILVFAVLATTTLVQAISFEPGESYSVGVGPSSSCRADFNGDGNMDLAVTHFDNDLWPDDPNAGISVLFGNGNGTFTGPVEYVLGYYSMVLCPDDFDGDGDIDLASTRADMASETEPDSLFILRNNGSGVLERSVMYITGVQHCTGMSASDLDGDGLIDLALTGLFSGTLCVMRNGGAGNFAMDTVFAVGDYPTRVCARDFDSDGDYDLSVVTQGWWADALSVFVNDGNGTFVLDAKYEGYGEDFSDVDAGDLNEDGHDDLIMTSQFWDRIQVRMNNGDGTFTDAVTYPTLPLPFSTVVTDFDNDGHVDLAVTCHVYDTVSILRGLGDGTFADDSKYAVGVGPLLLESSDFDGDGDSDLAVVNAGSNNVQILQNTLIVLDVDDNNQSDEIPADFQLRQNYPNPFNPSTRIEFSLPQQSHAEITIYNIGGQAVRHLVNAELSSGTHTIEWNSTDDSGKPVATGIYLCRLKAGDKVSVKKMTLVR